MPGVGQAHAGTSVSTRTHTRCCSWTGTRECVRPCWRQTTSSRSLQTGRTAYQSDPAGSGLTERIEPDGNPYARAFGRPAFRPRPSDSYGTSLMAVSGKRGRQPRRTRAEERLLVVVAGPNGLAKSTFVDTFSRPTGILIVNPDEVAKGLSPDSPEDVAYEAARVADTWRRDLAGRGISFCMETVLSLGRVILRVERGGHDVPDAKIETRFPRTFANLRQALTFVDEALLFDNSSSDQPFRFVAAFKDRQAATTKGVCAREGGRFLDENQPGQGFARGARTGSNSRKFRLSRHRPKRMISKFGNAYHSGGSSRSFPHQRFRAGERLDQRC